MSARKGYGLLTHTKLPKYLNSLGVKKIAGNVISPIRSGKITQRHYISKPIKHEFKYILCIKQDCHEFGKNKYEFVEGNVKMDRDVGIIVFGDDELTFVCNKRVDCTQYRNKELPKKGLVGIYLLCQNGEIRKFVQDGNSVPKKIDNDIRNALNDYSQAIRKLTATHVGSPADL
jgi:hypothetical protein